MNEKIKFISAYLNLGQETFRSLCERFEISCKTGYKYVARYEKEGVDGLKERSRAPLHCANQLPIDVEETILTVKHHYPTWGAKKILHWLEQERYQGHLPARSTVEALFKKHQLVRPGKRRKPVTPYTEPFVRCENPNDSWSIDYKGQFALGNQQLCYPLTVTDNFSRYLLAVEGSTRISGVTTKKVLSQLFAEFGLPLAIRSDNGAPFAGRGLAGLSQLAVWFIKLGIIPERIQKGRPQENGRHERMHLTLKQETSLPPQRNQIQQQRRFDIFKTYFNEQRPHEGIAFSRPAWLYTPSARSLPKKLPLVEYDASFMATRRVRANGTIKWTGKEVFISETLMHEAIGLKPYSEDEWLIYFSFFPLGIFNEKTLKVRKV